MGIQVTFNDLDSNQSLLLITAYDLITGTDIDFSNTVQDNYLWLVDYILDDGEKILQYLADEGIPTDFDCKAARAVMEYTKWKKEA